uniref:DUF3715 domain-containing protein n=1 Tax=Elaeophora elaphi TaxID=1147741 RepID=A0A0R3RJM5_9BILA
VEEKPIVTAKIITDLFEGGEEYLDYPAVIAYECPVDATYRIPDVESQPIERLVAVYHSGRSDEPVPEIFEIPARLPVEEVLVEEKPVVTAKIISGLSKKGEAYLDYSATGTYEGPVDSTYRIPDVERQPIEELVSVYHCGRSDFAPAEKIEKTYAQDRMNDFSRSVGAKLAALLGRKAVVSDYPLSETCVGPLFHLSFSRDVECLPLHQFVSVYHCGQSDLLPGELPFEFFVRRLSDVNVESRLSKDGSDRMLLTHDVKPLVPPSASAYTGEYRLYRPLDSKNAAGRSLPVGIAHPFPKVPEVCRSMRRDEVAEVMPSEMVSAPHDFDYHRKTREVDYWIGRRSERQSKPCRDLGADIGIDLASDASWEEHSVFETHPLESSAVRQTARDFVAGPGKTRARKVSPTANLHWTTVSETTSVSYKKRISIERRRPHPTSPSHLTTYRRQYRPPPPPPEVSTYARHGRSIFESSTLPRTYAGVAIEGDLRMQRTRYEASSLPSTYYSSTETRVQHNPVRYDLPRPSSPPRYEYWTGERNKWTVEGSPRQFSIPDQSSRSVYDDQYVRRTRQEALHYQKSNLDEIPIISLINDLPMIEDGADECSCATILPAPRIETQDLTPGEHSRPSRSAPLRRARQRIRNLCTML